MSEGVVSPRVAVAVLEPEPAPEPQAAVGRKNTQQPAATFDRSVVFLTDWLVATAGVWDAYASETEVTHWLKEQGLGRIAGKASEHEDYGDMESYEDLAEGPQAAVDRFCNGAE